LVYYLYDLRHGFEVFGSCEIGVNKRLIPFSMLHEVWHKWRAAEERGEAVYFVGIKVRVDYCTLNMDLIPFTTIVVKQE